LPFIENDKNKAIQLVQNILNQYPLEYAKKWYKMMFNKLGIINPLEEDKSLITNLIELMHSYKADYTNTFASLTMDSYYKNSLFSSKEFKNWKQQWNNRIGNDENSYKLMKMNNPIYIPRNHLVESALKNAVNGDKKEFDKLLDIMSNTYNYDKGHDGLQTIPDGFDESYKTFCGT